eukprot:scaffold718_cov342-Pavlova_lutheri.AAC.13
MRGIRLHSQTKFRIPFVRLVCPAGKGGLKSPGRTERGGFGRWMGRWRGGSRGCSTWIPESVTHALTHSVHIVGGISSKLSHAHDEASTDTVWFSGTTSSCAVQNRLSQRDPTPPFPRTPTQDQFVASLDMIGVIPSLVMHFHNVC